MKKQVIQNFFNLPGIVGLGLMDGHSRPYFCGIDTSLNFQQKEALTQGIQQVINTTPSGFEAFDFNFAQQNAHIYKLGNGVILLVVTDVELDAIAYQNAIEQLKSTLETDPHSAVSTFRLLAGSTTLNKQKYWTNNAAESPTETPDATETQAPPPAKDTLPPGTAAIHWPQIILALNALTDATAKYLGKIVVANTWRSTRPSADTIQDLQVDRSGHFTFTADAGSRSDTVMNPKDQAAIHEWIQRFVERCSTIIRDYPEMVLRQALNDQQRLFLGLEVEDSSTPSV